MKQSEHGLQVGVAHMLELCLDPSRTWWSAIDHGAGKLSRHAAGMMKARGVKRGLPDFIILTKNHPRLIGLELKSEKGRLSDSQLELREAWNELDYDVYTARSMQDVHDLLLDLEIPMCRKMIMFGESV